MRRFADYADEAKDFASPYIERTGEFLENARDTIENKYYKEKKKYMRKRRIVRLKNTIDKFVGVVLIVATIIAAIIAVISFAEKYTSKKRCKIKHCFKTKQHSHANKENVFKKESAVKKEKPKHNHGYITL